jgi:hypothetical protein
MLAASSERIFMRYLFILSFFRVHLLCAQKIGILRVPHLFVHELHSSWHAGKEQSRLCWEQSDSSTGVFVPFDERNCRASFLHISEERRKEYLKTDKSNSRQEDCPTILM